MSFTSCIIFSLGLKDLISGKFVWDLSQNFSVVKNVLRKTKTNANCQQIFTLYELILVLLLFTLVLLMYFLLIKTRKLYF